MAVSELDRIDDGCWIRRLFVRCSPVRWLMGSIHGGYLGAREVRPTLGTFFWSRQFAGKLVDFDRVCFVDGEAMARFTMSTLIC